MLKKIEESQESKNAVESIAKRAFDLETEVMRLQHDSVAEMSTPAEEAAKKVKAELDAAESKLTIIDCEPVLGESPVQLNRLKSLAEKAREEVVSLQESLEAKEALLVRAADENEALFLSLYKSFSNVLMERLPEASAAQTLNELKFMHVDEMSIDPEEKSAMDLDNENETNQNSQSNGERTKKAYNVGEREQWCITTLGYVKTFSRHTLLRI